MQSFTKGAFYRLLFMGFNFLVGLFIAVLSGKEGFGIIALMIANAAVVHIITGLGTESALVWHGADNTFDKNKVFTFSFISLAIELFLFLFFSWIYYIFFGKLFLSKQNSSLFYYEFLYFSGLVLIDKYSSLMYASQQAIACNKILAIVTAICFALLLLVRYNIFTTTLSSLQLFCVITFIQAIGLLLFYHLLNRSIRIARFTIQDIQSFIHFSAIVFITNLLQFFAYRADYWIIHYYWPVDQLGIYAQAGRFAQLLWVLPSIVAALSIPVLVSGNTNYRQKEVAGTLRRLNYLNLFLVPILILLTLFFYQFFLQPFYEGFYALLLMLPGFYFFCTTLILAAYFSAKRMLWINFRVTVCCLALILILDFVLIPLWGIKGAAIANSIAYLFSAIASTYFFVIHTRIPAIDLFRFSQEDWRLLRKFEL